MAMPQRRAALALNVVNFYNEILDDDDDGDETKWEKITVNVDEYCLLGDPCFRMHFRLTKPTFEALEVAVVQHLVEIGRYRRERRPFQHILLMVLWILATPDTFRSVALRFGVHPSVVHMHYAYVIEALVEMGPRFIEWPNEQRRREIARVLQRRSGFPGVVGIIDVCHIPILAPVEDKEAYRDYKNDYSLSVQVVCDHQYLVQDLYVGEPGSLHDARVFRRSPLCRNLFQQNMLSREQHIIGDGAYMLLDKVLVPFDNNGHLTPRQLNYNRRLSQIRVRVEHTFAHSQALWRRLQYLPVKNLEYGLDHIVASFVLNNFRIRNGENYGMFGDVQGVRQPDDNPVIRVNPVRDGNGFVDLVFPDPHVVDEDIVGAVRIARLRGDQKRWDICNDLPM